MPLLAQFGDRRARSMRCASCSTSDFGSANVGLLAQRAQRLLLDRRLDLALELELEVAATPRAARRRSPLAMPNALANSASSAGSCGSSTRLHRQRELALLCPRLPCRGSRRGTSARNVLVSPAFMPVTAASNSGSMRPSPSTIAKVLRLAARELDAVDRAGEVDVHAIAVCAPRARPRRYVVRCLRSTSSVRSTSGGVDLDLRPLDRDRRRRRRP